MARWELPSTLVGYEFRGLRSGVSQSSGNAWMQLVLEEPEGGARQMTISVPQDMQGEVYNLGLRKGDYVTCQVLGRVTDNYQFIQLEALPELYDLDA